MLIMYLLLVQHILMEKKANLHLQLLLRLRLKLYMNYLTMMVQLKLTGMLVQVILML